MVNILVPMEQERALFVHLHVMTDMNCRPQIILDTSAWVLNNITSNCNGLDRQRLIALMDHVRIQLSCYNKQIVFVEYH